MVLVQHKQARLVLSEKIVPGMALVQKKRT